MQPSGQVDFLVGCRNARSVHRDIQDAGEGVDSEGMSISGACNPWLQDHFIKCPRSGLRCQQILASRTRICSPCKRRQPTQPL